jgi:hypothetical protein
MTIPAIINVSMFALVGATLAAIDCGVMERPLPFIIIMVAMAVTNVTARLL